MFSGNLINNRCWTNTFACFYWQARTQDKLSLSRQIFK